LAKNSDILLRVKVEKEADTLNMLAIISSMAEPFGADHLISVLDSDPIKEILKITEGFLIALDGKSLKVLIKMDE